MKTLLTLAFIATSLALSVTADIKPQAPVAPATKPAEEKPAATKAYPLKTCIVSDNDLDSMGEQASFVYQGQTIKVCCKACIAKFEKNPAKYLKKLEGK